MPVDVLVPPLGTTVDTLTLVAWYRREGDEVEKDQPLFSVETDKATLDVEAPAAGILRLVTAAPGDEVTTLSRIALITAPGEEVTEHADADGETSASPSPLARSPGSAGRDLEPVPSAGSPSPVPSRERVFISPRARRLAETHALEWRILTGTGPEGAIIERDVHAALQSEDPREAVPMAGIRAVTAARLAESARTTVPVTLTTEVDATELVAWRERLIREGTRVSYNDLLLHLLGRALRDHPLLNASLEGDAIRAGGPVHIGVAVDTERGLLVPVLRDADRKSLDAIGRESAALVEAARAGTLPPEAMRGGTFTLTNLGMFGIDAFTPVINLPECAILGVGRIKAVPAVVESEIRIRQRMWLSLTFDHRLVDGGPAARFLQRLVQLVEACT
jgi:pyruvate dehydrogenase E2 component (dihydrolipoamide acetyltransferase)